ncbi:MAG TPA: hypothetical protein PKL15_09065 [Saprospiraceae bacterium]|nr:hypothetical protein [Saprospiraceae bacterium]HNL37913.1 hypothetical protein [Saprospiraceae bacterium]HNM25567.1 hypothetical protein [Saprospiraceae bacterium]
MKNSKNLLSLLFLTLSTLVLTSCLHIVEEVTLRNDNTGNYKMTIDMSEIKSMMDALKDVGGDSTATDGSTDETTTEEPAEENSMADMGEELSGVSKSLRGVAGISNIQEMNDTANYKFGYSFDFANVDALNKAMKIINKEKYDASANEYFKFKGKNFERLGVGDIGAQLKQTLLEGEDEDEENTEMMKVFFAEMDYKQIYTFPDRMVKKSSNPLSEVSPDGHSVTITLKPFDEEQAKQKASVATTVKLK